MSVWRKALLWLRHCRTMREQVDWAYGLWLAGPRTTNAATFISNITGIPRDEVWGILLGKKEK